MMRSALLIALAFVIAGCFGASERPPVDPLSDAARSGVIFIENVCTKEINGKCVVATCKQDKTSDCRRFANGCLDTGHHYTGTAAGGT
jgi:hypothetical protein